MRGRAAALAVTVAMAIGIVSCGGKKPPPPAPAFDTTRPHWQDAFDRTPDILVVAHPLAMGRDPVYGALLTNLSRMMSARAPMTAGTRTAEVFETCDEVIFGLRERGGGDALVVLRGVRADFDARKLGDGTGTGPMWVEGPRGRVTELTRAGAADASLFVLPDRTWVFALGDARQRAREAFAHPFGRPPPVQPDASLILVRLDGPSLVQGVPRLRSRGAALEPVGRHLAAITLTLRPGKEGLAASFIYAEEDAAAFAETRLAEIAHAFEREGGEHTKWLGQTKVERQASTVVARVSLPPQLLEELPKVSASDLGF